jgi:hypothetical protein
MHLITAAVGILALGSSLAHAQNICDPLDPADASKEATKIPVSCEDNDTDCVEACVAFFNAPNQCTASIPYFANRAISVWDAVQVQTQQTGQDATTRARDWVASFAAGTTSLPEPDPTWPGSRIYLAWDYGLFKFVYDLDPPSPFTPQRVQFSIRFEEGGDVKGILVDAAC